MLLPGKIFLSCVALKWEFLQTKPSTLSEHPTSILGDGSMLHWIRVSQKMASTSRLWSSPLDSRNTLARFAKVFRLKSPTEKRLNLIDSASPCYRVRLELFREIFNGERSPTNLSNTFRQLTCSTAKIHCAKQSRDPCRLKN